MSDCQQTSSDAQQSPIEHQLTNDEIRFPVDGSNHAGLYRLDATLETSTAHLKSRLPAQNSAFRSECKRKKFRSIFQNLFFFSSVKKDISIVLDQPINPGLRFPCDESESSVRYRSNVITETPTAPKARPRRLYYPGDVPSDTDLTPRSSKKYIASLRKVVTKQSHRIKITAQKVRRQQKRIETMKTLLEGLKKKNMISDNAMELLQVYRCHDNVCRLSSNKNCVLKFVGVLLSCFRPSSIVFIFLLECFTS